MTVTVASNRPFPRLALPQVVAMAAMADRLDTSPITRTLPRGIPICPSGRCDDTVGPHALCLEWAPKGLS